MQTIFLGTSFKGLPTGHLNKFEVKNFKQFCEMYLRKCKQGTKVEDYVVIGDSYDVTAGDDSAPLRSYKQNDHFHRNNKSQVSAWLLPFDGDNSVEKPGSCIEPILVHKALKKLKYNHCIYTTHSHIPLEKIRWRLFIPCKLSDKSQLAATMGHLFKQLQVNGCEHLAMSNESKTWSIPWFLPTRDNPDDGAFEYYSFFNGRDFFPVDGAVDSPNITSTSKTDNDTTSMLEIIQEGIANSGLHETTRNYAYGLIKDGMKPAAAKSLLHTLTKDYDLSNARQQENKGKIDALVDSIVAKMTDVEQSSEWSTEIKKSQNNDRVYTKYPDQGGVMENFVKVCMDWMIFPNRQIAVTACHAIISTLGGRVYTLENGSGIVLTTLLTGRSTIGKSNVKKFCIFVLNNFKLGSASQDFIGSHFYTSSKNLVDELRSSGSLLSVRTESGQSDKSLAGDMKRVMLYELELATESGRDGYVSSGGQNDKIPDLFSPSVTTIRESVAEIQNEADVQNATSISGVAGRRSHVIIDPVKSSMNEKPLRTLPKELKSVILELYKLAVDERRKDIEAPLPPDCWHTIKYKNPRTIVEKSKEWLIKENEYAADRMHFEATFYGRLYQRVPAYASRLAIVDNPLNPRIMDEHIEIAENSLVAELEAHRGQQDSGELDDPWTRLISRIVDIFTGNMAKKKTLLSCGEKMLKDGACEWTKMLQSLGRCEELKLLKGKDNFHYSLEQHLKAVNIHLLPKQETIDKYKKRSKIYRRG